MKHILIVSFLCLSINGTGQKIIHRSFEDLFTIEFASEPVENILESISFDKSISSIIMEEYQNLDKSDPLYNNECEGTIKKVIEIQIDRSKNEKYLISHNSDCCCSYGFLIYKTDRLTSEPTHILTDRLVIPGNGYMYAEGRKWRNFTLRQKFELTEDGIREVEQSSYYIGLKSHTLRTVKIYTDKDLKSALATIPADNEVEVISIEKPFTDNIYLVRSSFGLIGYAKLEAWQYKSIDIEGIYYWGD